MPALIVEETRQARQAYLEECGNTLLGLYKNLKQNEENSARTYYKLPSKPAQQMRSATMKSPDSKNVRLH